MASLDVGVPYSIITCQLQSPWSVLLFSVGTDPKVPLESGGHRREPLGAGGWGDDREGY